MIPLSSPFTIFQLDTVGYKESPPIPARAFDGWSWFYLISGEVLTEVAGTAFLVHNHEFLLVPPGVPFRVDWYRSSIGYAGGFEEGILKDRSYRVLQAALPVRIRFRAEDEGFFDELLLKLYRDRSDRAVVTACLDILLQQADRDRPAEQENSLSNRFLDAVFDRNRVVGLVSSYAAELGVTANHLNRSVKAHTGRTAQEWIDISRMSLARELLRRQDIPIIDVSVRVGLDDQSYFSRFFRKHEGMTPMQYRNKKS